MHRDTESKVNAAFETRFAHLAELRSEVLEERDSLGRRAQEQLLRDMDRHVAEAELGRTWLSCADLDHSDMVRKNIYREMLAEYIEIHAQNAPIKEQMEAIVQERAELEVEAEARKTGAGCGAFLLAPFIGLLAHNSVRTLAPDLVAQIVFIFVTVLVWSTIRHFHRRNALSRLQEAFRKSGAEELENARKAILTGSGDDHDRYWELVRQQVDNPFPHIPIELTRTISREVKSEVFQRDGGMCQHCGSGFDLEYDHIMPYSLGGSNAAKNIQLLCSTCNRSKGNRYFY